MLHLTNWLPISQKSSLRKHAFKEKNFVWSKKTTSFRFPISVMSWYSTWISSIEEFAVCYSTVCVTGSSFILQPFYRRSAAFARLQAKSVFWKHALPLMRSWHQHNRGFVGGNWARLPPSFRGIILNHLSATPQSPTEKPVCKFPNFTGVCADIEYVLL